VFANRFTALADACALVSPLKRNLLLSLAEAEFFRVRWSARILDETERAMAKLIAEREIAGAVERAARARRAMERAFEDAAVTGYEGLMGGLEDLPDPDDAHVIAAAVKTRTSVIVTDNVKHCNRGRFLGTEVASRAAA
jgi:predicted nucleic acid-binding protein